MSENLAVVKVSATAEDKVDPDLAIFTLRFGKKCETQQECADDFAAEQDRVIRALEPFGIADALGFDGYSSYVCTSGRRAVVTGYEYYCSATLKVEREGHDIAAIWAALAGRVSTARVNLHFELSDEDAEERRLIGTAVAKARLSAEALAAAAGTELAGVKEIRYNRSGDSCFWGVACADGCATPSGAASSMPSRSTLNAALTSTGGSSPRHDQLCNSYCTIRSAHHRSATTSRFSPLTLFAQFCEDLLRSAFRPEKC